MNRSIILEAAIAFEEAINKTAGKSKVSRNGISKNIEKSKKTYKNLKSKLDLLEKEDAKRQKELNELRSQVASLKKTIGNSHKVLQNLDVANADDAVFYNDSDDVGYIIDGGEYHLEVKDDGELELTPMRQWRRSKKLEKASVEEEGEKENVSEDEDTSEEEKDDDTNEVIDFLNAYVG